jgi:hypothetical protein
LAKATDISLFDNIQLGSGAHPGSYPLSIGDSFLAVKWQGCEVDRLPPTIAEIKNGGGEPQLLIRLHGVVLN